MDNVYIVRLSEDEDFIKAFSNPEDAANVAKWLGTEFEILKVEDSAPKFGWELDGWVEVEWDRVNNKAEKVVTHISKPRKILAGNGNEVYVERFRETKYKDNWVIELAEESNDSVGELTEGKLTEGWLTEGKLKSDLEKAKNILMTNLERSGGEVGLEGEERFEKFCKGVEEEVKRIVG